MTKTLSTINITTFAPKDGQPGHSSIGGTDALDRRIENLQVSTEKLAHAARVLLAPRLEEVEAKAQANLQAFLEKMDDVKRQALAAHQEFARANGRIFKEASGQAVNQTLGTPYLPPAPLTVTLDKNGGEAKVQVTASTG